uniref:Obscurin-like cytoskeletal adaptor 1 n=1 Tax=Xenopus tropicalis TaxID=8364 RepID=A0A803JMW9_XENTR
MVPRRFCTVSEDLRLALSLSRADAEVRWYKDGERLRDAPHILVEERGAECSLTILGLERADAGEYLCDVSRDSFSFYVAVGDPPVTIVGNTGTPEQHLLMTGDDLVLTCELSRPNFKVRWLRNGEELVSAGRVKILARGVHRQLTIQNVRPGDSGTYTCDAGTDQMHTSVYVEAPRVVEFVTELQNITVLEGETASFKCMVSPDDVDLRWELNGSPVYSDKRFSTTSTGMCHSLTLRSCRLSDSGKVTANAEGLLSRAKLRVQGKCSRTPLCALEPHYVSILPIVQPTLTPGCSIYCICPHRGAGSVYTRASGHGGRRRTGPGAAGSSNQGSGGNPLGEAGGRHPAQPQIHPTGLRLHPLAHHPQAPGVGPRPLLL